MRVKEKGNDDWLLLLPQILRAKISECRVDCAEILGVKWLCIQGLGTPDF